MKNQCIDVIIAAYNCEKYIEEAIASVQAQTWRNLSIILADDGSSDRTLTIMSEQSKTDNRINVLALPHRGVSATLNTAIKYSTAEYIAFLDADDVWHEQKLEKQLQFLSEGDSEICFCLVNEFETYHPGEKQFHSARIEPLKGYSKTSFLGKKNVFKTFGLFNEKIAIGDFVEWFSRIVRAEQPIIMVEEVLAYRRVHSQNTTGVAPKTAFLTSIKMHLDEKRKKANK
jgi:glycosyltransferase involved in cell wall biosynthesis